MAIMSRKLHCRAPRFVWVKFRPDRVKGRAYPYETQTRPRKNPVNAKLRWEATKAHGQEKKRFKRFKQLPQELQQLVWDNALSKPGIHFFAAVITPYDKEWDPTNPYAWIPPMIDSCWIIPPYDGASGRVPPKFADLIDKMKRPRTEEGGIPMRNRQNRDLLDSTQITRPNTAGPPPSGRSARSYALSQRTAGQVQAPPEREMYDGYTQRLGMIRLVEPEEGRPSGSFLTVGQSFPPGCVSAYKTYDGMKQVPGISKVTALKSLGEFEQRLHIPLGGGKAATIDAANDLVYVKFFKWSNLPNSAFETAMYSKSPSNYHHQRCYQSLSGIRRVALEIDDRWTQRCTRPTELRQQQACMCRTSKSCHSPAYEEAMKRLVSFLWCFPDLECVYLVFDYNPQWDMRSGIRKRYTTFGPGERLNFTSSRRRVKWTKREADTFHCPGGTLREPSKPIDRLCMLVDNIHWHYHHLDESEHTDRMNDVKFRMLNWVI